MRSTSVLLVKIAVLAAVTAVALVTVPAAVGWWQAPCPHYGDFPGKQAIGLASGIRGCYYLTPAPGGVDVTVAYAATTDSLPGNVADAKAIDAVLWQRLPFAIKRITQYPNAFAPGDAATDKIVASRQDMTLWFGSRPAALDQSTGVPLTTSLRLQRVVDPFAGLSALVALGLVIVAVGARRYRPARRPVPAPATHVI
jgi:hypothetical protein